VNLFFGQVDAALVTDFSYQTASSLNHQIPDALRIIRISQPLIHMLVSVRKDFPPQIVNKLIPFTKALDKHPRLQYLKKTFLFEGITKVTADDVFDIDRLNKEYLALKKVRVAQ
jgi:ABC-type phosphate/phosphonate transport system substrate-binding protein